MKEKEEEEFDDSGEYEMKEIEYSSEEANEQSKKEDEEMIEAIRKRSKK